MPLDVTALQACATSSMPAAVPGPCVAGSRLEFEWNLPMLTGSTGPAGSAGSFDQGDIELTLVLPDATGRTVDACTRPLLAGDHETPDDCEYATHRLRVFSLAPGAELSWQPDMHPRIVAITKFACEDECTKPGVELQQSVGTPLAIELDQTIEFGASVLDEDLQAYEAVVNGGAERIARTETRTAFWYRSSGEFAAWDRGPFGVYLDDRTRAVWTATEPGLTRVFIVLRDNRSGITWDRLDLLTRETIAASTKPSRPEK